MSEAIFGEQLELIPIIASILAGIASFGFLIRECIRRSKQLDRLEKEFNADSLLIRVPNGIGGMLPTLSLKDLQRERRILAISGNKEQLKEAFSMAKVFRRRLLQASVAIIAVPTDKSTRNDWGLGSDRGLTWVAEAGDTHIPEWLEYFNSLIPSDGTNVEELIWFGLKYNGRSFGSGLGTPPRLMELFGSFLQPRKVLDIDELADKKYDNTKEQMSVLVAQRLFYDALVDGYLDQMTNICSSNLSEEVTEVRM